MATPRDPEKLCSVMDRAAEDARSQSIDDAEARS